MKLSDIPKEELEAMNYDDIAYIILNENKKAQKINTLFKGVCDALELSDAEYEAKIADFFGLLTTDKRFIMLEDGSWDLKELHNPEVVIDDEDEDESLLADIDSDTEETSNEEDDIFYESDTDDDLPDDDLEDLVVIDVDEEETNN